MSQLKDPIEVVNAFIEYAEKTKKYHDVGDYKLIKMELEANNRNLVSMTKQLQNSTSNAKILKLIKQYYKLINGNELNNDESILLYGVIMDLKKLFEVNGE